MSATHSVVRRRRDVLKTEFRRRCASGYSMAISENVEQSRGQTLLRERISNIRF
jgi:hypothetical protein